MGAQRSALTAHSRKSSPRGLWPARQRCERDAGDEFVAVLGELADLSDRQRLFQQPYGFVEVGVRVERVWLGTETVELSGQLPRDLDRARASLQLLGIELRGQIVGIGLLMTQLLRSRSAMLLVPP